MKTVTLPGGGFLRLSLMGSLTFVQPLRHCFAMPPLLVGEALAYRKASPLRQRLPYKGSWREAPERLDKGEPVHERKPLARSADQLCKLSVQRLTFAGKGI